MPTYDYQCRSCGSVTEVIHSMLEEGPTVCERCGGDLRRVLYPAGIIFKGSGFYRTDSRSTESKSTAGAPSSPKTDASNDSTASTAVGGDAGKASTTGGSTKSTESSTT